MRQKLLKCFLFDKHIRDRITFSDPTKIRLDDSKSHIALKPQGKKVSNGKIIYPLDSNLFVRITPTNPQTLKGWFGFSATPRFDQQPPQTFVRYKLSDGTNDFYWDGVSWVVALLADWNTEAEVAANISSFPVSSEKLGVVINLETDDIHVTPTLKALDLLMEVELSYLKSLIVSLIRSFRNAGAVDARTSLYGNGSDTITLTDIDHNPNIDSVLGVYDAANDPEYQTNLFQSYDSTSKTVKLTTTVISGTPLLVRYMQNVEVYLNFASQDYVEIERVPAVIVDRFTVSGSDVAGRFEVGDVNTNTAVVRKDPKRVDLQIGILLLSESKDTMLKLIDWSLEHETKNALLHWQDIDENISLRVIDEAVFAPRPNLSGLHQTSYTLLLENISLWLRPEETYNLIERLKLTITGQFLDVAPRFTGVK